MTGVQDVCSSDLAGTEYTSGGKKAARLWKNGKQIDLEGTMNFSAANDVFVTDNGDVYVAGSDDFAVCYWKNGKKTELAPAYKANSTIGSGIYVIDDDVYVSGVTEGTGYIWKNGVKAELKGGTPTCPDALFVAEY